LGKWADVTCDEGAFHERYACRALSVAHADLEIRAGIGASAQDGMKVEDIARRYKVEAGFARPMARTLGSLAHYLHCPYEGDLQFEGPNHRVCFLVRGLSVQAQVGQGGAGRVLSDLRCYVLTLFARGCSDPRDG